MAFPTDIHFVQAAAQDLGVKFPPDYVLRITRENGGTFSAGGDVWELYPVTCSPHGVCFFGGLLKKLTPRPSTTKPADQTAS